VIVPAESVTVMKPFCAVIAAGVVKPTFCDVEASVTVIVFVDSVAFVAAYVAVEDGACRTSGRDVEPAPRTTEYVFVAVTLADRPDEPTAVNEIVSAAVAGSFNQMIFLPFVKSDEESDKVVAYEDASFDIVPEPDVESAIDSSPDNVPPTKATATGIPVVIEVVIDEPATFVRVTLVGAPPVESVNAAFASPSA
jgi:hypothetical protein